MRFLLRVTGWLLLGAAGTLVLLFGLTSYVSLAVRVTQPNFGLYGGLVPLPFTPARYQALRLSLGLVGLGAAGLLWLTRRPGRARPLASPKAPRRRVLAAWWSSWLRLSRTERWLAGALLLAVAAARLYYAGWYPLSLDEVASYDYCVLPGPAVTASYYPFPNNHLLPNLLVGLVHYLVPAASPALALRLLPTLAGLLALPVVYALALRHLRFGVATLGLGWFWLSPLAVYYAVAGRGYAWALLAALAGLFAALELLRPAGLRPAGRRLAWVVFMSSGGLGLYAVPTHLYALLALGLGLLVGFGRQPRRVRRLQLAHLALASLGIGLVALVLYAPVGAVSGWPALLANRYVARHEWAEFRHGFGPFLVITATELLGQRGLSAAAYLALLALAPVALRWGRLPVPARRLGWLAYAQLALWLPLAAGQRVYPPARTLLLVLLVFFVLLALSGQALLARWRPAMRSMLARASAGNTSRARRLWRGGQLAGLAALLAAYGGYRLHREQAIIAQQTRQQVVLHQDYAWLRAQPLRRIWVEPRAYAIFWHHYALSALSQRTAGGAARFAEPAAR